MLGSYAQWTNIFFCACPAPAELIRQNQQTKDASENRHLSDKCNATPTHQVHWHRRAELGIAHLRTFWVCK